MGSFAYYLPGRTTGPHVPQHLIDIAFDGREPAVRPVLGNGPDGGQGCLLSTPGSSWSGYYPEEQVWQQVSCQPYWLGIIAADKPTAAELARNQQLGGHWVKLGGQPWLVPVARRWTFADGVPAWMDVLPKRLGYVDGQWAYVGVAARYAKLWSIAARWWDETMANNDLPTEDATHEPLRVYEVAEMAVEALSFNYAVWHQEMASLGVLDESGITEVLNAVIDLPTYRSWAAQKKTVKTQQAMHDGSSTLVGVTG